MPVEHVAWLNGEYFPLSQASLSILDPGVLSGAIVSERLRTFRHEPFLLNEHLERLSASARAAFLDLPAAGRELEQLVREVVARNAALVPASHDLAVSLFATAGGTLCIYATAIPAHSYAAAYDDGISLIIPPVQAMPPESFSPHIKTRNRLHWHIADAMARQVDSTARALLVDGEGFVTETPTGNLFLAVQNELFTPRRTRTLRGTSQSFVIELAERAGFVCREADMTAADLALGMEAFVTSSIYCMLPVVRLEGAALDSGRPGPVYQRLLRIWSDSVGLDIAGQMKQMAHGARGA